MLAYRDAATVVLHLSRAVLMDDDADDRAVPGHRLIDGVVNDLVHQVMQALRAGGADVHTRPLAHGFEPLEDCDVLRAVRVR